MFVRFWDTPILKVKKEQRNPVSSNYFFIYFHFLLVRGKNNAWLFDPIFNDYFFDDH